MTVKLISVPQVWAGSEDAYLTVLNAVQFLQDNPDVVSSALESYSAQDDELSEILVDSIYSVHDNVAVLNVSGPLVAGDSWFNLMFGLVSYNTISGGLQRALDDHSVSDIVLSLSTSGGDVNGLEGVSENIRVVREYKPIISHTGSSALSAGYWLFSTGSKGYATSMSQVGSVGVISTFTSFARRLKDNGIDVSVFRAGKYKALANPAEPLSAEAAQGIQDKTDKFYQFFLEKIHAERPALKIENKEEWAEGKTFFAQEALSMKMVDGIMSMNQLVDELNEKADAAKPTTVPVGGPLQPDGEDEMSEKKVILSPKDVAAVASGAPLTDVPHEEMTEEQLAELQAQESENGEQAADTEASTEGEGQEAGDNAAASSEDAPAVTPDLVSFMKEELKELRTELADAKAQNALLTTQLEEVQAAEASLKPIAIEAVHNVQIALGQAPVALDELPAATVAEQYRTSKEVFDQRFTAGQKSLASEDEPVLSRTAIAASLGIVPKS